jgi:hypothetical protein
VIGYGGGDDTPRRDLRNDDRQNNQDKRSYNTNSVLQLVGNGPLSDAQKKALTAEEKKNLDDQ